ncbi:MAG: hypothetical protein ABI448_04135 [Bacteroidia bacterium]
MPDITKPIRAIVTANHTTKACRFRIIDGAGRVLLSFDGYDYSKLKMYDFLFKSLGEAVDGVEEFHFTPIN